MTNCSRCLFTSDFATIGENGICNYCDLHDELESQSRPQDLLPALNKIRNSKKKYDCLVGISGGLDSSTLLYAAVKHWNLHPLVIHFDNGWNAPEATHNMNRLVERLGVDCIIYKVNKIEYDKLNDAFLRAGLPDADIPNDIAMTKLMYETADRHKIKWILNGHDFRTEGSTPAKWTYMDARYIQSVYFKYTNRTLRNYPLFTFSDQIKYALKGIKQIRPFHFGFDRKAMESDMKSLIGWQDYGAKHCENVYTEFVGAYLLPNKFDIDKRIVYLSAQVRSGFISKAEAIREFREKSSFDFNKLGARKFDIVTLTESAVGNRNDFDRYNFKRYRLVIWMLMKMKIVPFTFWKKYAC